MGKIYTPFSDQKMRKKKPYPLERHIPKLNYTAYTRDGTPRDLHEVIYCQCHLTIILQFALACYYLSPSSNKNDTLEAHSLSKEFFATLPLSVTLADT